MNEAPAGQAYTITSNAASDRFRGSVNGTPIALLIEGKAGDWELTVAAEDVVCPSSGPGEIIIQFWNGSAWETIHTATITGCGE